VALTAASNYQLIDANGVNVITAGEATSSATAPAGFATTTVTWSFANASATGGGFQVSGGGSYTFTLKVNSNVIAATSQQSQALNANIQAAGDVTYWDALDANATSTSLPASVVPLVINSITYPVGQ